MNLSPNFTLDEMLRSEVATRWGYDEQFFPGPKVIDNLKALAVHVLQPLRNAIRKDLAPKGIMRITSGYRCARVNTKVGGSPRSQHITGNAADFHVPGLTIEQLYQYIKKSDIEYDQLIQEFDTWIHISFTKTRKNRRQNLRAVRMNGKARYIADPA
jgi:hypothetical protein